eukprot:CAMPEP_0176184440 /NCGR_PEP_ID=MMETSP0121_2-20121125/818_1 /TAXON_ID=160619 /ORGANISM="Kryptoperidinium foliaceum, Strain CCMP 1326" /LENGTH=58 /DNA_ID=CAMNT_0017522819 /DNA_START=153 /DNA_END=325 /DNA_ORIENTATION=+
MGEFSHFPAGASQGDYRLGLTKKCRKNAARRAGLKRWADSANTLGASGGPARFGGGGR